MGTLPAQASIHEKKSVQMMIPPPTKLS